MRFKGRMEPEHGLKQIDIVPLVNIIFLLLIFFMLTSSLVIQPSIRVDLPNAVTGESIQDEFSEIIVSAESAIYLNSKTVSLEELQDSLKQLARRNQAIMIKADRHASLGVVTQIWDLCREAGVKQLNVATSQ